MRTVRMSVVVVTLAVTAGLSISSAGASAPVKKKIPPTLNKLAIVASEYTFRAPSTTPAGWTAITITNKGAIAHQAQLARLNPGVTFAQLQAAAAKTPDGIGALALITLFGGPNNVGPGKSVTAISKLVPGDYVIVCVIPDADGKAHLNKGMTKQLSVKQSKVRTKEPKAIGTITENDFSYTLPAGFTGKGMFKVTNAGQQPHELIIERVADGKTFADVKKFILSPPGSAAPAPPYPAEEAGGVVGIPPGGTAYVPLDLAPGQYVLTCFFPDPAKGGLPHAIEGMYSEITIPS